MMQKHLRYSALLLAFVPLAIEMRGFEGLVALVFLGCEFYRCWRIHQQTSDVDRETVAEFYRADLAHRFLPVGSTVRKLRQFAIETSHEHQPAS